MSAEDLFRAVAGADAAASLASAGGGVRALALARKKAARQLAEAPEYTKRYDELIELLVEHGARE